MGLQKEVDFYHRIRRLRVDRSSQSLCIRVPDFYGEKIGIVKYYRNWLKDQRAYNNKRQFTWCDCRESDMWGEMEGWAKPAAARHWYGVGDSIYSLYIEIESLDMGYERCSSHLLVGTPVYETDKLVDIILRKNHTGASSGSSCHINSLTTMSLSNCREMLGVSRNRKPFQQ